MGVNLAVVLSTNPASAITPKSIETKLSIGVSKQRSVIASVNVKNLYRNCSLGTSRNGLRRSNARLSEIEPDLNEDPIDRWETPGVDAEDFVYGEYDGHHTYFEGQNTDPRSTWELILADIEAVGTPTGFQGFISWIFLPVVFAGMYFNVPMEYLFIGAAVYATIFCIIEMDKPDQPHNFEPEIYTMERGARDKLINDYNTMSIWDFNEKYGDVWDFTVKKDDIMKR